ncbi:zinc finger, C3HC4 type, partial [Cooperia oncophora]
EHGSPSLPSLYSLAPSDMSGNEPLCRICHCCWPSDASDPLISPCRCSGSLQYVHVSCLMHWLDISSRKLHRPAVCELCLYKYRRRRVLKYREIKLPDCSDRDVRYYTLFVCALAMMILSALATIVCFQLEKSYSTHSNK